MERHVLCADPDNRQVADVAGWRCGYWTFRGVEMGQMSAAISLAILPMIVLSFFVQRYMLRGLTRGAVKG